MLTHACGTANTNMARQYKLVRVHQLDVTGRECPPNRIGIWDWIQRTSLTGVLSERGMLARKRGRRMSEGRALVPRHQVRGPAVKTTNRTKQHYIGCLALSPWLAATGCAAWVANVVAVWTWSRCLESTQSAQQAQYTFGLSCSLAAWQTSMAGRAR